MVLKKISIVIISDTHNKHKRLGKLPKADIIIHCGDFTSMGHEHEIINFMKWYSNLSQYNYRVIISGNHDWFFETNGQLARSLVPSNVIYLEDSEIIIEGLKFYGSPVSKPFNNWAFNREEHRLVDYWKAIPDDTDILITHTPPYMIGDYVPRNRTHEGSPSLYFEIVERIKPLVHCFGHLHEGYGIKVIENTTFINASNLDGGYMCVNNPVLIEIIDGKVNVIHQ